MHETHLRIANLSLHIWFLYDLVVSAISIVSCSAIQMKVWFQELPSVNSLFIFPQGYTRLKYWSTRQGRVVFLVLQKHLMQTTTISHNPMMRPSMKMTPGQTGNNTLLHKKRAQ